MRLNAEAPHILHYAGPPPQGTGTNEPTLALAGNSRLDSSSLEHLLQGLPKPPLIFHSYHEDERHSRSNSNSYLHQEARNEQMERLAGNMLAAGAGAVRGPRRSYVMPHHPHAPCAQGLRATPAKKPDRPGSSTKRSSGPSGSSSVRPRRRSTRPCRRCSPAIYVGSSRARRSWAPRRTSIRPITDSMPRFASGGVGWPMPVRSPTTAGARRSSARR